MTTGEKIRHYRKLRGLYQGELGERIGVSEGAIRHYETDFRTPKQPQVEAIAEALGRPQRTFADQMRRYRTELRRIRGF